MIVLDASAGVNIAQDTEIGMLYLCLARREGATLLTLDKKLAALCQRAGVNCIAETTLT